MKRTVKILAVIIMAILVVATLAQGVFATIDFNQFDTVQDNSGLSTSATNIIGVILGTVRIIAAGVAVIMLIVLAIKYISAAPGDKAEIKKHAVVYIVGAVVLFGASGILSIVQKFATTTIK